jgi:hypothetical protein
LLNIPDTRFVGAQNTYSAFSEVSNMLMDQYDEAPFEKATGYEEKQPFLDVLADTYGPKASKGAASADDANTAQTSKEKEVAPDAGAKAEPVKNKSVNEFSETELNRLQRTLDLLNPRRGTSESLLPDDQYLQRMIDRGLVTASEVSRINENMRLLYPPRGTSSSLMPTESYRRELRQNMGETAFNDLMRFERMLQRIRGPVDSNK